MREESSSFVFLHVAVHDEAYRFANSSSAGEVSSGISLEEMKDLFIGTRKYLPLARYLIEQQHVKTQVELSFEEIEKILESPLPPSARKFSAWWSNEQSSSSRHVQSRAWVSIGWRARADLKSQRALFQSHHQ